MRLAKRINENEIDSPKSDLFARNCLRVWINTLLRLIAGTYFVLTSLYCLLAYLPYTYFFLVKAPPYAWMPWFVHHQAALYWLAASAATVANWPLDTWKHKDLRLLVGVAVLFAAGIYLSFRPFLPGLEDNRAAYSWGLTALIFLIAIVFWKPTTKSNSPADAAESQPFAYSAALLVAIVICAIYEIGARIHLYFSDGSLAFHTTDAELTAWTLLTHVTVAIAVISIVNLIFLLAARTAKAASRSTRRHIRISLHRAVDRALSLPRWRAELSRNRRADLRGCTGAGVNALGILDDRTVS